MKGLTNVKVLKPFYVDWCKFSTGPDVIGKNWFYTYTDDRIHNIIRNSFHCRINS